MHYNRTHLIFWAPAGSGLSFEPGYTSFIETFMHNVAADSHKPTNVYGLTGQYHDSVGRAAYRSRYAGAIFDSDQLPANGCTEPLLSGPGWGVCLTQDQLQSEIAHVVATDKLPTGLRDIYFLVTPNGFGSCINSSLDYSNNSCALGGSGNGYCAYHANTWNDQILYAVIPYVSVPGHCQFAAPRPNSSTADPTVSYISHEHNEVITDPLGDQPAWIDPFYNENGDLCLGQYGPALGGSGGGAFNQVIAGWHYHLQLEWSNDDGGCKGRDEAARTSFTVSRHPARGHKVTLTAHATDPDGSIAAFEWRIGKRVRDGRTVTLTFSRPGPYKVVLKTVDVGRNWAYATGTITVLRR